jgi:hypothetical protein
VARAVEARGSILGRIARRVETATGRNCQEHAERHARRQRIEERARARVCVCVVWRVNCVCTCVCASASVSVSVRERMCVCV